MLPFRLADGETEYEIYSSELEMSNVLYAGSTNRSLSGFKINVLSVLLVFYWRYRRISLKIVLLLFCFNCVSNGLVIKLRERHVKSGNFSTGPRQKELYVFFCF